MTRKTRVSILVPAYNEEANVERAYAAICDVFAELPDHEYEIIFTDNHSTDRTPELLRAIAARDANVRVIRFSRNYGYERSLLVAYKAATGACSVQLDCDLQDPPELIPRMLELWRSGHQVVYGIRRQLEDGPLIRASRRFFYRMVAAMSHDDLPIDAGEFRLVDARILAELRRVEDSSPYVRGLISSMGFSQVGIEYDRRARVAGVSKFPLYAMLALATDGILNHSLFPLRLASLVGIIVGSMTLLVMFGYMVGKLILGQQWPAGFATTTVLLLMSISVNALLMGILGEYLGRIFLQTKKRPAPIVEEAINLQPRPFRLISDTEEQRRVSAGGN